MAWLVPSASDLASALSQKEIDAFRSSPGRPGGGDPVRAVLDFAASEARGACRSNGRVRLAAAASSIPASLMRAVVAIAAFDVLKRLPVPVGEDRRIAKDDALKLLADVAAGRITPESDGEESLAGGPAIELATSSRRRATPRKLESL